MCLLAGGVVSITFTQQIASFLYSSSSSGPGAYAADAPQPIRLIL
jgi:hypothetical protein